MHRSTLYLDTADHPAMPETNTFLHLLSILRPLAYSVCDRPASYMYLGDVRSTIRHSILEYLPCLAVASVTSERPLPSMHSSMLGNRGRSYSQCSRSSSAPF